MPAWPGGPCPQCGDDMPARLVHCRTCRALLNDDLDEDSVEIPTFQPFAELDVQADLLPRGFYLLCPHCQEELRINQKYTGERVGCKFCDTQFEILLDPSAGLYLKAYYGDCPHCSEELRIGVKYAGQMVVCKFCGGKLKIIRP